MTPRDGNLTRPFVLIRKRHLRSGRSDIYFQVTGSGDPVVLIHGLSGSSRWWRHNIPSLSRHHRVYVIDLIRFGRSRTPEPFVLTQAASSLVHWMDRMGIDRASFVGHSMGGYIAADLAASFPERVERLVLVDAALLLPGRSYLDHAVGLARAARRLPRDFYPVLVTDALLAGPRTILRAGLELVSKDVSDRLGQIQAPTLVVWGEHDELVPLWIGRRIHEQLPTSRFVVIKRAGHVPMWDQPVDFDRSLREFLDPARFASPPPSPTPHETSG